MAARIARAVAGGLREYYDPFTREGMGATEFSWSALVMELVDPDPAARFSHVGTAPSTPSRPLGETRALVRIGRGRASPGVIASIHVPRTSRSFAPHRHPQQREDQPDDADDHEDDPDGVDAESAGRYVHGEAKNRSQGYEKK
ncbi:MAG: hypothetical protein JO304_25795 [Solirubrobacterales bacterium]|nr:hypothetical protein [Solirubrobacterales bacterium]